MKLRGWCLALILASACMPFAAHSVPSSAPVAPVPGPPADGPMWSELTENQRTALKPLAAEWNALEPRRKKKWIEVSSQFQKMTPGEQTRLQQRMREWAKLTPEQRQTARETYRKAQKLPAQKKRAQWEKYQTLPEEHKKQLKTEAAQKQKPPLLPPALQTPPAGP